jgi:hypothetical protein
MIFGEAVGKRLWQDPRRFRANEFATELHLFHGSRTDYLSRVDGGIYKLEPVYFVRPHQVQV